MSLLISLSAQKITKEITLDEAVKLIIPDQKLLKNYESKGNILNLDIASKSGHTVIVEEFNKKSIMSLFDHNFNKLWQKEFSTSSTRASLFISEDAKTILINLINFDEEDCTFKNNISSWDFEGNKLGELNNTPLFLELSKSGNYIFISDSGISFDDFEYDYRVQDIQIFDRNLNQIHISGLKKDNSIISYKLLSDSLLICLRQYPLGDGRFVLSEGSTIGKQKIELYRLERNHLIYQKNIYDGLQAFNMLCAHYQDTSIIQSNDVIIDRKRGKIFSQNGDLLKENAGIIGVTSHGEMILSNKNKSGYTLSKLNNDLSISKYFDIKDYFISGNIDLVNEFIVDQEKMNDIQDDLETTILGNKLHNYLLANYKIYNIGNSKTLFFSRKIIKLYGVH